MSRSLSLQHTPIPVSQAGSDADGDVAVSALFHDPRSLLPLGSIVYKNLHKFRVVQMEEGEDLRSLSDDQWGILPLEKCHHISTTSTGKDGPQQSYRVRICKTCCQEDSHIELGTYVDQESAILVNDTFEILNDRHERLIVLRREDRPFLHYLVAKKYDRAKGRDYSLILDLIAERIAVIEEKKQKPSPLSSILPVGFVPTTTVTTTAAASTTGSAVDAAQRARGLSVGAAGDGVGSIGGSLDSDATSRSGTGGGEGVFSPSSEESFISTADPTAAHLQPSGVRVGGGGCGAGGAGSECVSGDCGNDNSEDLMDCDDDDGGGDGDAASPKGLIVDGLSQTEVDSPDHSGSGSGTAASAIARSNRTSSTAVAAVGVEVEVEVEVERQREKETEAPELAAAPVVVPLPRKKLLPLRAKHTTTTDLPSEGKEGASPLADSPHSQAQSLEQGSGHTDLEGISITPTAGPEYVEGAEGADVGSDTVAAAAAAISSIAAAAASVEGDLAVPHGSAASFSADAMASNVSIAPELEDGVESASQQRQRSNKRQKQGGGRRGVSAVGFSDSTEEHVLNQLVGGDDVGGGDGKGKTAGAGPQSPLTPRKRSATFSDSGSYYARYLSDMQNQAMSLYGPTLGGSIGSSAFAAGLAGLGYGHNSEAVGVAQQQQQHSTAGADVDGPRSKDDMALSAYSGNGKGTAGGAAGEANGMSTLSWLASMAMEDEEADVARSLFALRGAAASNLNSPVPPTRSSSGNNSRLNPAVGVGMGIGAGAELASGSSSGNASPAPMSALQAQQAKLRAAAVAALSLGSGLQGSKLQGSGLQGLGFAPSFLQFGHHFHNLHTLRALGEEDGEDSEGSSEEDEYEEDGGEDGGEDEYEYEDGDGEDEEDEDGRERSGTPGASGSSKSKSKSKSKSRSKGNSKDATSGKGKTAAKTKSSSLRGGSKSASKAEGRSSGMAGGGGGMGGAGGSAVRARSNSMPTGAAVDRSDVIWSILGSVGCYRSRGDPLSVALRKYYERGGVSGAGFVGIYSPEDRRQRIQRFLEKRKRRMWAKKVKYDVRKNFADSRIRVKGRFVKKQAQQQQAQASPSPSSASASASPTRQGAKATAAGDDDDDDGGGGMAGINGSEEGEEGAGKENMAADCTDVAATMSLSTAQSGRHQEAVDLRQLTGSIQNHSPFSLSPAASPADSSQASSSNKHNSSNTNRHSASDISASASASASAGAVESETGARAGAGSEPVASVVSAAEEDGNLDMEDSDGSRSAATAPPASPGMVEEMDVEDDSAGMPVGSASPLRASG